MEGVILLVCLILCFIWNICSKDTNNKLISCLCPIMFSTIFLVILIDYNSKDEPTALDIYEGKTTLQITYEDSIPIDTVVIFKTEFRNRRCYKQNS